MAQIEKAKPATKSTKRPSAKPPTVVSPPTQIVITPASTPMTKRDRLQARLEQADGASLKQLLQEFGWQPHTVRAAISGLRKAGFSVHREVGEAGAVYRIVSSKAA
ncbi:MAG: DUF3489 domain-containing protein [Albidovulum sp.]